MPYWWNQAPENGGGGLIVVNETVIHETVIVTDVEPSPEMPEEAVQLLARLRDRINPRIRFVAFNLSAGALGYSVMGASTSSPYGGAALLASLQADPVPASVAVLSVAAPVVAWHLGKVFRPIGGVFGWLASPVAAISAGMWGQGTGPLIAPLYDQWAPWPQLLTPLALAVGAGSACWWLFDRRARARGWALPLRWAARIPLATVTLSALLYPSLLTTGAVS
ncbi:hypothetical protein ACFY7H_33725 [Streptomyces sp. NPDC012794]|uniref:hypothetical protein n=1 Tax=Streptomyces sp. NPDC012794 TaxID=3364850 RepID=UPI0036ACA8CD